MGVRLAHWPLISSLCQAFVPFPVFVSAAEAVVQVGMIGAPNRVGATRNHQARLVLGLRIHDEGAIYSIMSGLDLRNTTRRL